MLLISWLKLNLFFLNFGQLLAICKYFAFSSQDGGHASESDHDIEVIPELPPLRRGYSFGTEDMETEAPFPGRVDDPPDLVRDVPSTEEAQEHADQVMVDWLTR